MPILYTWTSGFENYNRNQFTVNNKEVASVDIKQPLYIRDVSEDTKVYLTQPHWNVTAKIAQSCAVAGWAMPYLAPGDSAYVSISRFCSGNSRQNARTW